MATSVESIVNEGIVGASVFRQKSQQIVLSPSQHQISVIRAGIGVECVALGGFVFGFSIFQPDWSMHIRSFRRFVTQTELFVVVHKHK